MNSDKPNRKMGAMKIKNILALLLTLILMFSVWTWDMPAVKAQEPISKEEPAPTPEPTAGPTPIPETTLVPTPKPIMETEGVMGTTSLEQFAQGDGSENNPYLISTPEQLDGVRNYMSASFRLIADIDVSKLRSKNWLPIGSASMPFRGTFDGNGKKILKLNINRLDTDYVGLFGYAQDCTIKDLSLESISVIGEVSTGGLVGCISNGTITNCSLSGTVQSTINSIIHQDVHNNKYGTGGVVGVALSSEIEDTSYTGAVITVQDSGFNIMNNAPVYTGGLLGIGIGSIISSCHAEITINGLHCVGGIVGCITDGQINNTSAEGKILCDVHGSEGLAFDYGFLGGFAGKMRNGCIISDCSADSEIVASNGFGVSGGFAGIASNGTTRSRIVNCSAAGSVLINDYSDVEDNRGSTFGGFAGSINAFIDSCKTSCSIEGDGRAGGFAGGGTGTIKNSSAVGSIKVKSTTNGYGAGGFVGSTFDGCITDCYSLCDIESTRDQAGFAYSTPLSNRMYTANCFWYNSSSDKGGMNNEMGICKIGEPQNTYIPLGGTVVLQTKFNALPVTIEPVSSSNEAVASVGSDGAIHGVAVGKAVVKINVTFQENMYELDCPVTVGTDFVSGQGTAQHPYIIQTAQQLSSIADYPNAYYRLSNDVDLLDIPNWVSIGTKEIPFTGSFDGGGYTISGMTIDQTIDHAGLFGYAVNAELKNIHIEDAFITVGNNSGGLVGYMDGGKLSNCSATGQVTTTTSQKAYSGMLVGYMNSGLMIDCYAIGDVNSYYAGVFAGYMGGEMTNCYWYNSEAEKGIAQGDTDNLDKIQVNIDTLQIGQVVEPTSSANNATALAATSAELTVSTNFKLHGNPTSIQFIKSSNPSVASVSDGKLKALKVGTAFITTKFTYANGTSAVVQYKVSVKIGIPSVTTISAGYMSAKISWTSEVGASGYEVWRSTSNNGTYSKVYTASAGTLAYTDTGLITGKTYYYKVRAYCNVGSTPTYGSYSSVKSAKPVLATPSAIAASTSYNSVKISWNKISGANGYAVYRATSMSGSYSRVGTVTSGSTVSYSDKSLTTGKTYYYKVRAYRTVSEDKVYSGYSSIQSAKPIPAKPSITAKSASYNSNKISWDKISGASGYVVYRATSSSGSYSKVATVTGGSTASYTNKSLTSGKTYYYKVRAYRTVSGNKVYGSYSSVKSAKPIPVKPSSVKAARASSSSIKISWAKVSGANGYEVYRATSKTGSYSKVKAKTSTSYINTGLTTGKTYYYKVRAYRMVDGKKVYGSFSSIKSAKP